ncbi:MAG: DNA polymerase/3'-5' exonuclease PolX [Deltaproteobacteria bacterium]|nr:DNA polymerase/3'-5' exonuclease PolX [Deltaproteobacteria bacterium]
MKNKEVAVVFQRMADLLEVKGENPFRIRAYRRAAQHIENLAEDIAVVHRRRELDQMPGIGKDLAGKISEIVNTGTLRKFEELKKEIPAGLLEVITIHGLGPRTAKALYEELGVDSIDALERLAKAHQLQGVPGIKSKTENNILKGIELYRQKQKRMPLNSMLSFAREIMADLRTVKGIRRMSVAGSLRRRKETIRDIDIVAVSSDPERVMDFFTGLSMVETIQAKGRTKSSIRTAAGIQVDLRVVDSQCFGAALCYFTGSKAHNIRVRELAARKGIKVNEYGVFRNDSLIGGKEEEEVYKIIGLSFIPPELREDSGEIEAALEGKLPLLLERKDIRGDLHVHSNYSDGTATLEEISQKAETMGHEWVAVCDHSQSLKVAGGVSRERMEEKIAAVKEFNRKSRTAKLLCGAEVDVNRDGTLDYPDELLARLDIVIAAVHSLFKQDEKTMTARIVKAMRHPRVHCVAHPTGRLIGEREGYAVNLSVLMDEAAQTGTALEINAYPQRLDLNDVYCRMAGGRDLRLGIGTDAHRLDHMDYLEFGISVARRGWLGKKSILNTLSYDALKAVLKKKENLRP